MKNLKVPVRLAGGIMHDTDYARGAQTREEAEKINAKLRDDFEAAGFGTDPSAFCSYVMEEVKRFSTSLKVFEAGHNNSFVWLTDGTSAYPMFITDYVELMNTANISDGWIEPLTYETCKKGARYYGIRKAAGQ